MAFFRDDPSKIYLWCWNPSFDTVGTTSKSLEMTHHLIMLEPIRTSVFESNVDLKAMAPFLYTLEAYGIMITASVSAANSPGANWTSPLGGRLTWLQLRPESWKVCLDAVCTYKHNIYIYTHTKDIPNIAQLILYSYVQCRIYIASSKPIYI